MLDNLRAKPESVRRQVAVIATITITGVIGSFWIGGLPERFSGSVKGDGSDISPFAVLKEQGKVLYDSTSDGVSAAKNILGGEMLPAVVALPGLPDQTLATTTPFSDDGETESAVPVFPEGVDSFIPAIPE